MCGRDWSSDVCSSDPICSTYALTENLRTSYPYVRMFERNLNDENFNGAMACVQLYGQYMTYREISQVSALCNPECEQATYTRHRLASRTNSVLTLPKNQYGEIYNVSILYCIFSPENNSKLVNNASKVLTLLTSQSFYKSLSLFDMIYFYVTQM